MTPHDYATAFKTIHRSVIVATRLLIESGIWSDKVSDEDKTIIMGQWVQRCAEVYGIPRPKFFFIYKGSEAERGYKANGGGRYCVASNAIYLYQKASLVTLAHEFRHAMQHTANDLKLYKSREVDARAWSLSLFRIVAPTSFERAVKKDMLFI